MKVNIKKCTKLKVNGMNLAHREEVQNNTIRKFSLNHNYNYSYMVIKAILV